MARLEIHPFRADHLDESAVLLARRHAQHRHAEPSLPASYEEPDVARAAIEAIATADASGAVASRGGDIVGFLLGTPRESPTWGPNVWVEAEGHSVAQAEDARDLYGFAAARWVEEGRTSHYAVIPAGDDALVDAWFHLGFGLQHVHAITESPQEPLSIGLPGVEIRPAAREDLDTLAELELTLPAHQMLSPVFSTLAPPSLAEARAEWEEDFGDPAFATFVAVQEGRVVGSAIGCSVTQSGLHTGIARPDHAAHLGFAAVREDARGAGVGRALGETVLDWAAAQGYPVVVTDWRATNLLSSRAWPRLGWRPAFLRLHRSVA